MQFIRTNLSALLRAVRLVLAVCVCTLMLFTQAVPAYSLPNPFSTNKTPAPSDPTEGAAHLMDIEKDSQEAIYRPERAAPGQEETIRKTNPGLNGVQGTANADQMKRPGNSASTSVEEMVGNALEDLKS